MNGAYRLLCRAEAVVAGLFLVLMVMLVFGAGVARLLGSPLNWANDVATCLFAWACFLCADIAWRADGLMSIDLLSGRLPAAGRRALALVNLAIIALFLLYLVWTGVQLSWISRARPFQGMAGVSYSWVTASLPAGAALLLLTTFLKAWALARRADPTSPAATA